MKKDVVSVDLDGTKVEAYLLDSDRNPLVSCHLCDVAKMTVIPAEAGIQKPEVARNTGFPPPRE